MSGLIAALVIAGGFDAGRDGQERPVAISAGGIRHLQSL